MRAIKHRDDLDKGLPFEWSGGRWSPKLDSTTENDEAGLFALPSFDIETLKLPEDGRPDDTPFQIADIPDLDHEATRQHDESPLQHSPEQRSTSISFAPPLDDIDLWHPDFTKKTEGDRPRHLTWEAFQGKSADDELTSIYFSEAGASVFDAALAKGPQNHLTPGVLPQDVTLRAMCALVLGRSSVAFSWDAKQHRFVKTLQDVPVSGFSLQCCDGFVGDLLEYGTQVRYLRSFASQIPHRGALPSVTALRRCIDIIVDSLEISLARKLQHVRSIQQLQHTIDHPRQLLETLRDLTECYQDAVSEERAISSISDRICVIVESGSIFTSLLREVLTRVCAPWLADLANDLGLGQSSTTTLLVNTDTDSDIVDEDDVQELPSFITADDFAVVQEAKASLRILVKHDNTALAELHGRREHCQGTPLLAVSSAPEVELNVDDFFLPAMDISLNGVHNESIAGDDPLSSLTEDAVSDSSHVAGQQLLTNGPYDTWKPLVLDQYHWINHKLLQHMFVSCDLMQHFHLQHSFHLFGNGEFISQLSTALFSAETQTTERRRGVLPTSKTVGLRLGATGDKAWPPASSELRLALLGILNEVHYGPDHRSTPSQADLPGGLSFSIRELPDAEIERVMDPTSIYALDFLRLQYTAPAPLDTVLTRNAMDQYDEIFRFMLRMMRLSFEAVQFRRRMLKEANNTDKAFSIEAHHVISTLMSHFTAVGIDEPWKLFANEMSKIQANMMVVSNEGRKTVGVNHLREQHSVCLERIRARLFLRRKQEKLQAAVQDILAVTLESIYHKDQIREREAKFRGSVTALLAFLQDLVDKPGRSRKTSHSAGHDIVNPARILLTRLDYNDFYRRDV